MENLDFKVFVGVKKENKELAKQQGIKYILQLVRFAIRGSHGDNSSE